MEFRLLGPFEGSHDGVQVDLGDLQQRYALVVLLLHANKPVSATRLIEIVWGDKPPRTNLIPGYIARLRKALRAADADDVSIETTPTGYVLRISDEQIDTHRFVRLYGEAARARERGDSARAVKLLHEAVDLWRGRFLEDLDIDRIGGIEVVSLDEALLDVVGDLAELELAAGNHRWARDRLRPAVHSDPSRQRLAVLLMRALLANGDRVEALKVYHRTRDALDEYGIETSADLRSLALVAQLGGPVTSLPPRPPRFTGRHAELASIRTLAQQAINGDGPIVIWVSGMPGIGKTALVVEAAHALRHLFTDGHLFISLNGYTPNVAPTEPAEALVRLLTDLGVPNELIPMSANGKLALYRSKLANTRTLVVLDNVASEEQIRSLLPESSQCVALVTSRVVGNLVTGHNLRLGLLPVEEATDLFRSLAGSERLSGQSRQVDDVVERCGRIPIQIKVVASQFRRHARWPLDHLLRLLNEAQPWSTDATFGAGCAVSYEQLDELQRTLFRLFGSVPGHDLGLYGTAALLNCEVIKARRALDELNAASLLEEAAPERYHMLDPLKDFANSLLTPAVWTESNKALERLLDFYLVGTATAIATLYPFDRDQQPQTDRSCRVVPTFADQKDAFDWLSTERGNLVAAIRHAAAHGYVEHTWQLAVLLWRYFYTTRRLRDWAETLELAYRAVSAEPGNRVAQAHVLLRLASAHYEAGELTPALDLASRALPAWVALDDVRGEADSMSAVALAAMDLGQHDRAIDMFKAALAKYTEIADQRGQANALSNLGYLHELHGRFKDAEDLHLLAVGLLSTIGHRQGLAHALDNLGSVRQRLGQLDEALANHQQARALAVEMGDRGVEAYALNNIGNVHRLAGRLAEASRYQEQARTVASAVADPLLRTQLHLDRGNTSLALGELRIALTAYLAALDLASATGDRGQVAHAHLGIARARHLLGEHEQATTHWHNATRIFTELATPEANEITNELASLHCACPHKHA